MQKNIKLNYLCVITHLMDHEEGLCPSSGDIIRLMMMMKLLLTQLSGDKSGRKWSH
jgi:hypothetical protein